jgi:hypothetical protein
MHMTGHRLTRYFEFLLGRLMGQEHERRDDLLYVTRFLEEVVRAQCEAL